MASSVTQTLTLPPITGHHAQSRLGRNEQRVRLVVVDGATTNHKQADSTSTRSNDADPSSILEPARRKLTTLEAQRIAAVVALSLRRAELATALPEIIDRLDELRVLLNSELIGLLEEHGAILDEIYGSYSPPPSCLEGGAGGSRSGSRASRLSVGSAPSRASATEDPPRPSRPGSAQVGGSTRSPASDGRSSAASRRVLADAPSRSSTGLDLATEPSSRRTPSGRLRPLGMEERGGSGRGSRTSQPEATPEGRRAEAGTEAERISPPPGRRDSRSEEAVVAWWETPEYSAFFRRSLAGAASLQASCRNILRAFANDPGAMAAILKACGQQRVEPGGESSVQFLGGLRALEGFVMSRLLTTPGELRERGQRLRELTARQMASAAVNEKLTVELRAAEEERDKEVQQRNDVIRRLQAELHRVEKNADDAIRRTKFEGEKQEGADRALSEANQNKLQTEVNQTRAQYKALLAEHREKELALRKRKFQIESEIENWIQKFDNDMGDRQDEYEQIDFVYTEEKKQLNELEERFRTLDAEYQRIMDARRAAREAREAAERELMMCVRAATAIQAFWRSFKVRKAIKSKKKGKGGKGAKGVKKGK